MRIIIFIAMLALAASATRAEVKAQANTRPALSTPAKPELRVTTTNQVQLSRKHPHIVCSGIAVQTATTRNPLQLINPFAPAAYGSGEANTLRNPLSGRPEGLKLFSIGF
ncbi:MAG: hypothetical protein NTW03_06790 [Verrucomicrobia bacterium]|nr:hypothetical protein [Verrucomicrobiota bacterium]